MKTIVLISCVSQKENTAVVAEGMYKSPLFRKSLAYAKKLVTDDAIYILSAKHHLLPLDKVIEPYNETLNKMRKEDRTAWGVKVIEQLREVANLEEDKFIVLAGEKYIEPIKDCLTNIELPLKGMRIGQRLQYLTFENHNLNSMQKSLTLRLHELFNSLERFSYPFEAEKQQIPANGIYVMFEEGETFEGLDRIVRVGTHNGDNNLFKRLEEHYVNENKNRSIFLQRVGDALLNKENNPYFKVWNVNATAKEAQERVAGKVDSVLEAQITEEAVTHIRKKITFVVFAVEEEKDRKKWEKKLIGTLSNAAKTGEIKASDGWLGNFSTEPKVKESGLWQTQGLYSESLTEEEFATLQKIV